MVGGIAVRERKRWEILRREQEWKVVSRRKGGHLMERFFKEKEVLMAHIRDSTSVDCSVTKGQSAEKLLKGAHLWLTRNNPRLSPSMVWQTEGSLKGEVPVLLRNLVTHCCHHQDLPSFEVQEASFRATGLRCTFQACQSPPAFFFKDSRQVHREMGNSHSPPPQ
ncbi:Hypothetical predicted protein [Podarcis lilfordi]|uniref:Uncharacterized protein n=1 Tax=Podarcis lilfordi TaxID=74358 RepID=A0AA35P9F2_9SAUR|nr:Hypothetical predicted protein [Podarcis lilfordi]